MSRWEIICIRTQEASILHVDSFILILFRRVYSFGGKIQFQIREQTDSDDLLKVDSSSATSKREHLLAQTLALTC